MLACGAASRPHSESADHSTLGIAVLWDIREGIDAQRGGWMLDCSAASRPHSESADHAAVGLSMLWDIREGIDAQYGGYFFSLGGG